MRSFLELVQDDSARMRDSSSMSLRKLNAGFLRESGYRISSYNHAEVDKRYRQRFNEALIFTAEVMNGKRRLEQFAEALTLGDFPLMFGDILDRGLMSRLQHYPDITDGVYATKIVRDFRAVRMYDTSGGYARLTKLKQFEPYPEDKLSESKTDMQVYKYGKQFGLSWETFINDDLQVLRDLPDRMLESAVATLNYEATNHHANTTIYNNTNGNVINIANGAASNNPPLTIAAFPEVWKVIASKKDSDNNPIIIAGGFTLEVPPALEAAAMNIINATQINLTGTAAGAATGHELWNVNNWYATRIRRVVVNPWLPIIDGSNGNTAWYIHINGSRPGLVMGKLKGYENPQVFTKSPNTVNGTVNDGDFDADAIAYKVRHVFGFAAFDYSYTYRSNGSGS